MKCSVNFLGQRIMHTLAFFATKGGAGRATALMTLASGLLSLGKRLLVIDVTDQVGKPSGLPSASVSGFADAREAAVAWQATMMLTVEILWALQNKRVEFQNPNPAQLYMLNEVSA